MASAMVRGCLEETAITKSLHSIRLNGLWFGEVTYHGNFGMEKGTGCQIKISL